MTKIGHQFSYYYIIERLNNCGIGELYKAQDEKLNRTVVLKFLSSESLSDESAKQHLLAEAQSAAALNHPNIATIYGLEQSEGLAFIVMEYVEGETIAEKLQQERFSLNTALDIAIQIAEAVRAIHERGFIHCDIKSGNIIVKPDGVVKVLDFGLARLICQHNRLDSEVIAGTASYMSPEQVAGNVLDFRTDLFSLGVVIYEMIAGCRPFVGKHCSEVFRAIVNDEVLPLVTYREDVPLDLEDIVLKALEKNPEQRYQSTNKILADLIRLRKHLELDTDSTKSLILAADTTEPARLATVRSFYSGHRLKWLWLAAILALSVGVDSLWLHSQGMQRIMDLALLTAAITIVAFTLLRGRKVESVTLLPKGAAFRGLLPFQEADRDRFYGRENDTLLILKMLEYEEYRFGILFGESGCGKTSLLKAGLLPRLWEQGYLPIYCRSYKDPLAALLAECSRRSQIAIEGEETLISYLSRVANELNTTLIIIFDQFEEFFINFKTRRERESFISFVVACHYTTRLPLKFLFSMRCDLLYLIGAEFDKQIPEPLMSGKRYHLRNFDQRQAEEIIERSARQAGLPFEAGLIRYVARDLAIGDTVMPSELQIVGQQLQSKRIYTVRDYRRTGGKEPLVYSLLEDVIMASGDIEGTHLLLRSLISDENTRLILTIEEICKRTQRNQITIKRLLQLFTQARLIREIQDEAPWQYELMHEYLIEKINQITGKVMDATQRANRAFRQYLFSYTVDKRTRIPISKLWLIRRYSDITLGERERELINKSLQWGLLKASILLLLLVLTVATVAATFSIREDWDVTILSDGHTGAVRRVAFSPDGKIVVSVGEDFKVIVWDFQHRQQIKILTDHKGVVTSIDFSPNGKWFATGSFDKTVIVWDSERLEKVAVLREHKQAVTSVAFSPDGQLLLSASPAPDRRTVLWNVGQWNKVREFPDGTGDPGIILFSPNGQQLFTDQSGIYQLSTGELVSSGIGDLGPVKALSPDGTRLACLDKEVSFWHIARFEDPNSWRLLTHQRAHQDHPRAIVFSPDGRLLATGSEDIILWDALTETKLLHLEHDSLVWSLDFSPDGQWLISGHADGSILLWSVKERQRVANFNKHAGPVRAVAFSPDGKQIASASDDRSVIIWDAQSGLKKTVLLGHNTRVNAILFSPDGNSVISGDFEGKIFLWNLKENTSRQFAVGCIVHSLAISPDGRQLAVSSEILDTASGERIFHLRDLAALLGGDKYGLSFSSDGKLLACAAPENEDIVSLLDTKNWQVVARVSLKNRSLLNVSFSPNGKQLVTGGDDGTVRLWTVNPLRQVAMIGQHSSRVKIVTFSPDGKQVVSTSDDQTIKLWDVAQERFIANIGSHSSTIRSAVFASDGKRLVTGEDDKSVRIYTRYHTLWGYRLD
ncbi:MAG: protein kinase [Acidobacteriota bacterium]